MKDNEPGAIDKYEKGKVWLEQTNDDGILIWRKKSFQTHNITDDKMRDINILLIDPQDRTKVQRFAVIEYCDLETALVRAIKTYQRHMTVEEPILMSLPVYNPEKPTDIA
jgi:hypothetical protein